MFKKLSPYVGKYKVYALLAPVLIAMEAILEILIPFIMSFIVDVGIKGDTSSANIGFSNAYIGFLNSVGIVIDPAGKSTGYVLAMGVLMVLLSIVSLVCGALSGLCAARASAGFAKNLRHDVFRKIQSFSFGNVDKFSSASLITRLTNDVTNTQNAFQMIIRMCFRSPVMFACALVMVLRIKSSLAVVFAFAVPILAATLAIIATKAHPRFKQMLKKYDALNSSVQENLIGIRVVKAFVRKDHENKKFIESADGVRDTQRAAEKLVMLNSPIMQMVMYSSTVAILWIGGGFVQSGNMLIGELSSFVTYISQILMSLMMIAMILINLVLSRASINRILEALDEVPEIADDKADASLGVADGSIDFNGVSFSYFKDMNNLALENVNLHIKAGETVGVIGGTGSSKSTLVNLIPRLYDVTEGSVCVGGHDVRDYKIKTLRDSVAMVLQKNVLFSGTIKDNLRWGDMNATDEEIIEACKAACAHEFIESFPDGYDTDLGQGGVNVSGGQKQRLCIARALLKKPKVIILDDSTSAVDTATDAKIRAAFREKLADTTTIIIAQRITSVMDADKIVIIDEGKITDVGTHDELLAKSEIYRELYTSQQKGAE